MADVADYVVVGGGSAGAVVAARLSESGDHSVVVLESGGSDVSPFILLPAGSLRLPPKHFWMYETEPDMTRNGRTDSWSSGRVLGGSSSVNAMLWVRGNPADYDAWANAGADGWDYESLLPFFRRSERWTGEPSGMRGATGPQYVSRLRVEHPTTQPFLNGAAEVGLPVLTDYNGATQIGASLTQVSQRNGLRAGTGRTYLAPARRRKNLSVRTHATADRVLFENRRAVGVEYVQRGKRHRVTARREVIICAGAVASPALLQRSGVGPIDLLRELGAPIVADVPAVGQGLQEHPTFTLMFDVNGRTLNQELTLLNVLRAGRDLIMHRRGLATAAMTHAVAFGKIHQDAPWAEFELMYSPMSAVSGRPEALPGEEANLDAAPPKKNKQRVGLPDRPMVSCHISLLHPRTTGQVRASSLNPFDLPKIDLAYYGDERDIADATAAGRLTRSIFESKALKPYVIREVGPSAGVESDEQWRDFLTQNTFNAGHWVGTVRMGTADDDHAALDSDLRVKGVEALRVIDASVMPNLTSGNTNAPTIALAEAGVHRLLTGGWRVSDRTGKPKSQPQGSDVG